jgi:UDP-galactopyranose mutase
MIDKVVIVGAGLTGSVLARLFAEKGKLGVTVLDRRNHVGGNVYDYQNEAGICIQKYGPHAFHTNSTKVYDFITEYGRWIPYELRVRVALSGKMTPSPFNLRTIDDFYSQKDARRLKKSLEEAYPGKGTITVTEMMASENTLIKAHAQMLFDKDYRLYTAKQWGIPVSQIDRRILERVPIRLDYQDRYFDDEYQCQPAQGYTQFIENLLNHPGISVEVNREALKDINFDEGNNRVSFKGISLKEKILLVYTGAIDELFDYRFGELPYRSLKFQYQTHHRDSFQEVPIVAYPQDPHFTRITEFKKLYPAGVAG